MILDNSIIKTSQTGNFFSLLGIIKYIFMIFVFYKKQEFSISEYLIIAAQIIFSSKNIMNIDDAIKNTKTAYKYMKKNHRFLTGSEDIASAALIATTSIDLEKTFNDIEECYTLLKSKSNSSKNNIQALSHILSLVNLPSENKCRKVLDMQSALKGDVFILNKHKQLKDRIWLKIFLSILAFFIQFIAIGITFNPSSDQYFKIRAASFLTKIATIIIACIFTKCIDKRDFSFLGIKYEKNRSIKLFGIGCLISLLMLIFIDTTAYLFKFIEEGSLIFHGRYYLWAYSYF